MKQSITSHQLSAILLIGLLGLFFITRLTNLMTLEPFTDEYMYAYWTKKIKANPAQNAFISVVEDGQQPGYFWLTAITNLIIPDPITAIRVFSVATGLCSLLTLILVAREVEPKISYLFLGILYIIHPLLLLHDRLGIKDSLVVLLALLTALFSIKLSKSYKHRWLVGLMITIIVATTTKSITYFYVALSFAAILFSTQKQRTKSALSMVVIIVGAVGTQLLLNQISTPLSISQKNAVFLFSPQEILELPVTIWRRNSTAVAQWVTQYQTVPLLVLAAIGLTAFTKRVQVYLAAWIVFPLAIEIITAKILFPRYFLFMYPFLLISIANSLTKLQQISSNKLIIAAFISVSLVPSIYLSASLIYNPAQARLAPIDRWQLLEGWPSGYGYRQAVDIISATANQQPVTVYAEKTVMFNQGLRYFFESNPNLTLSNSFSVGGNRLVDEVSALPSDSPSLLIFTHHQSFPPNWPFRLRAKLPKIGNQESIYIFTNQ